MPRAWVPAAFCCPRPCPPMPAERERPAMSTILKAEGLTKYFGAQLVLDDVALTLAAGDRVGLVGENGVGKSTLLRVLAGEEPPDAGRVLVPSGVVLAYLP